MPVISSFAMICRVHVNQLVLGRNRKQGTTDPAITAKCGRENRYGYAARITGPADVRYENEKPLSCGARVWVETREPVDVFDDVLDPEEGWARIRVSRRDIRENIHAAVEARSAVLEVTYPDGRVVMTMHADLPEGAIVLHRPECDPVVSILAPVVQVS